MNNKAIREFDGITELGKARSDEHTMRLLAFVQNIEACCLEPFVR
jgi:hypothetical protein